MKRIEVKDLPANVTAYELADGSIYRIHMDLITPVDQLAAAADVEVETRGYLIDKNGSLLIDENLEPITLPRQRARIPLANVRAGADTVKPGWVQRDAPTDPEASVRKLKNLPKTAEAGDEVVVDDKFYIYSDGIYEQVRRNRLASLDVPAAETLDPEMVANLIP